MLNLTWHNAMQQVTGLGVAQHGDAEQQMAVTVTELHMQTSVAPHFAVRPGN